MFEAAGFASGYLERLEEALDPSLLSRQFPDELLHFLTRDVEARTSWYVTAAYPLPWPGVPWLSQRLCELDEQQAVLEQRAEDLQRDLDATGNHLATLLRVQEEALKREKELRSQLLEAHGYLAARDRELAGVRDQVHSVQGVLAAREHELSEAHRQIESLRDYREREPREALEQIQHLGDRLTAIRRSLPGRIYLLLRKAWHRESAPRGAKRHP